MILFETNHSVLGEYFHTQHNINLSFNVHMHYSFELIIVQSGRLLCRIDNKDYNLTAGNMMLIFPGQLHSYKTEEFNESFICIFSNDFVERFYEEIKDKVIIAEPVYNREYEQIIFDICSENNLFFKKSVLYRICSDFYKTIKISEINPSDYNLTRKIAFYVQNHFTEAISLKEIAKSLGYSYSYLSQFFNRNFKISFTAYVNQFRLQSAVHYLETTDLNITEIALKSGFCSIRNFNFAFKAMFKKTPVGYRKELSSKQQKNYAR